MSKFRVGVRKCGHCLFHTPVLYYFGELLRGRFPQIARSRNRVILFPSHCFICSNLEEMISHLFLKRPFVGALWDLIFTKT